MSWNQWWRPRTQKQARGPWSRRAFIAGGGAVITLPFLESLSAPAWASGNGSPCPTRLIFYHTPNGMMMNDWTPTATGFAYSLATCVHSRPGQRAHQPQQSSRDCSGCR